MTGRDEELSPEELLALIGDGVRDGYQPQEDPPEPDTLPSAGTGVAAPVVEQQEPDQG
ncbi:hypothetical protein [Streptomyces sp. NPDC051001]|uniref:hypothetical protein n=1 Tax=Streptomyces sp. NPDC051001 TaxID=3155795 RepID=UPI0034295133